LPLTFVELRAEYGGTFLWTVLDEGTVGLDPAILDIPPDLADRLAAWNEEWEDAAEQGQQDEQGWVSRGRQLARELQDELPGIRVVWRYGEIGDGPIDDERSPCGEGRSDDTR
jgi:hypothetical protein